MKPQKTKKDKTQKGEGHTKSQSNLVGTQSEMQDDATGLTNKKNATKKLESTNKSSMSSSIPRNVNLYRHLINKSANDSEVQWVLALRNEEKKLPKLGGGPYSFYGKTIECEKEKRTQIDFNIRGDRQNIHHLYWHRIGPCITSGQVNFESGLRTYKAKTEELVTREKKWLSVPHKDRHEYPKFLPPIKEELSLRKSGKHDVEYSAFDGALGYPKYDQKLNIKNHNEAKHLCIPGMELTMVSWQLSLRGQSKKKLKSEENDQKKKSNEI